MIYNLQCVGKGNGIVCTEREVTERLVRSIGSRRNLKFAGIFAHPGTDEAITKIVGENGTSLTSLGDGLISFARTR